MWYLQIDTLLVMLGLALLYVLSSFAARRWRPGLKLTPWLLLLDLGLIAYVSEKLALFYAAYALVSFAFVELLRRAERGRRGLFVLFCLLDAAPFFYARAAVLAPALPTFVTLIGFSYNMLKAIDALFYVYYARRKIPALTYANFLLFFPVLTGGPIFRYRDFQKYYDAPELPDAETGAGCVKRLIRGLFKKVVLVVWLQWAFNKALALGPHCYASLALVVLSYALLYFDLSGYSDLAIAVGTFMGIPVPENFKRPLTAASFTQFWRKWHVTLSDWIREHIFVVVNGKRLNKYLSALIGVVTMLIMSLWHQFSLSVLPGALYMGFFLAIENIFGWTTVDRRHTRKPVYYLRCVLVAFFFGINAMCFYLEPGQLAAVLGGFVRL